jgi:hypothetical protein
MRGKGGKNEIFKTNHLKDYQFISSIHHQLPPPPPPNPPPEEPPPEPPLLEEGELTILELAFAIFPENDWEKVCMFIKPTPLLVYQFGGGKFNVSNLSAHLSNNPKANA